MPEPIESPQRRCPNLQAFAIASCAAILFAWLAVLGSGCGPGLDAVKVTPTPTGSGAPTGSPTPGKLSGDVLIAGGLDAQGKPVKPAELYDPTSQTFSSTGMMNTARAFHTMTVLDNGTILITGGQTTTNIQTPLNTAEIYNESTEAFRLLPNKMTVGRTLHTATLLKNGQVLITGGAGASKVPLNSAELYNPSTGKFTATANNMNFKRAAQTATLLSDGTVLIAGGYSDAAQTTVQNTAELYDPNAQTFTVVTAKMKAARYFDQAQILPTSGNVDNLGGQVLLAGGHDVNNVLATGELYDPTQKTFNGPATMANSRMQFASAITQTVASTVVLLCGGLTNLGTVTQTAELYTLVPSPTFGATGNMTEPRRFHTATTLTTGPAAGDVLVTGGENTTQVASTVSSAELYDPTAATFAATSSMANPRYGHTAIVLP